MIWVLVLTIIVLALYASYVTNKVKVLERRHDIDGAPTEDITAWLDLLSWEWRLLDYQAQLRDDDLSKLQIAAVKHELERMTKEFHERDSRRDRPVSSRPLEEMPIEIRDLYEEGDGRKSELDELEKKGRHPALHT